MKNAALSAPTNGTVTVTQILPTGLTLASASGSGWSCAGAACTRSSALSPGSSYPPITVTVSVATSAPLQVNLEATVSGGGSVTAAAAAVATVFPPPSAAVLASPANAATSVPVAPLLTWTRASWATSYDVYLGTSPSPPHVATTQGVSYTPAALSGGTLYYWRVVASNAAGSITSATWSFTTQVLPPAAPRLTSPANGAAGIAVTANLSWSAALAAASYDVYFGTVPSPPLVASTPALNYSPGGLTLGTQYYWRVVATNAAGSTTSTTWSFTTQVPAPPAPLLNAPANGATGISATPVLSWSASQGAASYDVYFGTSAAPPLAANMTTTAFSPASLNPGTLYYWRSSQRTREVRTPPRRGRSPRR